ncbi:hypothetical protein E4U17_002740 [Claviceps sp. LM77 group G4]|nr:hypothetical protein E4U17_002740 [Claviceps sp. LM77 group G4]KAG6061911.1 hypothetical protein E4U33_006627 [Claviceps sp. LM78 group G4]KAG6076759.1 hypothetical protein E4U16_002608 [Claviceps sp. LM84 group G4]
MAIPTYVPSAEGEGRASDISETASERYRAIVEEPYCDTPFVDSAYSSPVEWQPLTPETIEWARQENKLLFLHIGFGACNYCRTMLYETFMDDDCAAVLNESFVPVIVDRDERPDIETVYMNYLSAVSSVGGWPLNVFVTPDMEPVFGGTYWPGPGVSRRVGAGAETEKEALDSLAIFKRVRDIWQDQEAKCRAEASEILSKLRIFTAEGIADIRATTGATHHDTLLPSATSPLSEPPGGEAGEKSAGLSSELDLDQLEEAYTHIAKTFDPVYGGFGLAPKFPTPPKLAFLLYLNDAPSAVKDVVGEAECKRAADMAVQTLRKLRGSALYDQLGSGFSRCSMTRDWSIPLFEKLLADNALLLSLYVSAWRYAGGTTESEFLDTVVELADHLIAPNSFVLRDGGGLASSVSAFSEDNLSQTLGLKEGAYYLWTRREFDSVINSSGQDQQMSQVVAAHWDVREEGNVPEEYDPYDDKIKKNILRVVKTPAQLSHQFGLPLETVQAYIRTARKKLRYRRDLQTDREPPFYSDTAITSWNGLAISALTKAHVALKDIDVARSKRYLDGALRIADFIMAKLYSPETKTLSRLWCCRRSNFEGFADDYVYLIDGILHLFGETGKESLLDFAIDLQETLISRFHDPKDGGFFSSAPEVSLNVLRLKEGMDGSLPSVNAVAAANLFHLSVLLQDDSYAALANGTINAFEAEILQYPWLYPSMLMVLVMARLGYMKDAVSAPGEPEDAAYEET